MTDLLSQNDSHFCNGIFAMDVTFHSQVHKSYILPAVLIKWFNIGANYFDHFNDNILFLVFSSTYVKRTALPQSMISKKL